MTFWIKNKNLVYLLENNQSLKSFQKVSIITYFFIILFFIQLHPDTHLRMLRSLEQLAHPWSNSNGNLYHQAIDHTFTTFSSKKKERLRTRNVQSTSELDQLQSQCIPLSEIYFQTGNTQLKFEQSTLWAAVLSQIRLCSRQNEQVYELYFFGFVYNFDNSSSKKKY